MNTSILKANDSNFNEVIGAYSYFKAIKIARIFYQVIAVCIRYSIECGHV